MSGIAGIIDLRSGQPTGSIDLNLLQRMAGRLQHRGPDGISYWSGGPAALAYAAMHTTPESRRENQPHTDEQGWCRLVFDGRLDDRATLRQQLLDQGQRPREDTDAELALRAYLAWGESCAAHLLGDFALALWDGRRKQLYCARDILGLRPFYYSLSTGQFVFGSEPRVILEQPDFVLEPDELAVAGLLRAELRSNEETLYQGLKRLPPAHCITVTANAVHIRRYWAPDPRKTVRYSSDREYAEHFLDLFRTAVADRMRLSCPFGTLLSGGLDSSSIFSLIVEFTRAAGGNPRELESYSTIFPGLLSDESEQLIEMQRYWGHTANNLPVKQAGLGPFAEQARRDLDFPGYPNGDQFFDQLRELARRRGVRVMFTGHGGDEWLTGSGLHYADYIRRGQLVSLWRQWTADRKGIPADRRLAAVTLPRFSLLKNGLWPLLPAPARSSIKRLLGRGPQANPGVLSPALWRKVRAANLPEWRLTDRFGFPTLAQRQLAEALDDPWCVQMWESFERSTAFHNLEMRYPFNDRRIIEFSLALPEEQRWRGIFTKFVLREAMRGRIPESIRTRLSKADFSHLSVDCLLAWQREGIFTAMRLVEQGWIDPAALAEMWREVQAHYAEDNGEYTRNAGRVWMVVAMEIWARESLRDEGRRAGGC